MHPRNFQLMSSTTSTSSSSDAAYQRGYAQAINDAAANIKKTKARIGSRFSVFNFYLGVVNFAVSAFLLGGHQEHYWAYQSIKCAVLMCTAFTMKIKKHEQFYMLDFCWLANIFCMCHGLACVIEAIDPD